MPKLSEAEEQVLISLEELSPTARREALRNLLCSVDYYDRLVDRNTVRIEAIAEDRGLDWNSMTEEEREALIDEILHDQ